METLFSVLIIFMGILATILWVGLALVIYGNYSERGRKFKENHPKLYKLLEK